MSLVEEAKPKQVLVVDRLLNERAGFEVLSRRGLRGFYWAVDESGGALLARVSG